MGIGSCGIVALAYGFLVGGPGGFVLGILFCDAARPLLVFAVLSLDRLEPKPTRNLVLAFAWGAAVAVVIALVLEATIGVTFDDRLFGAAVVAPVVEETAKGLIIFLILHVQKTSTVRPTASSMPEWWDWASR